MNTINKKYVTKRSTNKARYNFFKSEVKNYMRTAPQNNVRLFEAILERTPDCWEMLYCLKNKL